MLNTELVTVLLIYPKLEKTDVLSIYLDLRKYTHTCLWIKITYSAIILKKICTWLTNSSSSVIKK